MSGFFSRTFISAAEAVAQFVEGHNLESFEVNRLLQSAVVHQLAIVGEAVSRVSPELRERYPNIPWSDIKGFRNIVVHNYFGIDWSEVWRAATRDLPVLRDQVAEILRTELPE